MSISSASTATSTTTTTTQRQRSLSCSDCCCRHRRRCYRSRHRRRRRRHRRCWRYAIVLDAPRAGRSRRVTACRCRWCHSSTRRRARGRATTAARADSHRCSMSLRPCWSSSTTTSTLMTTTTTMQLAQSCSSTCSPPPRLALPLARARAAFRRSSLQAFFKIIFE